MDKNEHLYRKRDRRNNYHTETEMFNWRRCCMVTILYRILAEEILKKMPEKEKRKF